MDKDTKERRAGKPNPKPKPKPKPKTNIEIKMETYRWVGRGR